MPPSNKEPIAFRRAGSTTTGEDSADVSAPFSTVSEGEPIQPTDFTWSAKREKMVPTSDIGEDIREQCGALARQARDAFREACEATEEEMDDAEACYAAAVGTLKELGQWAQLRDQPFRDLLGALDAALRYHSIRDFGAAQRDVLRSAFTDLVRWHLDDNAVLGHLTAFAEGDVDILGPILPRGKKRLRITIEEIEEGP